MLIGLLVGAVTLALALWGVPLRALGEALAALEWGWLLPIAGVFLLQQALRAWRQALIVRALAPASRWWDNLGILCMSFLCINLLPARLGEVVRPYLLMRKEGLSLGAGFGAVFVERLVDLSAVLFILQAVLLGAELPAHTLEMGSYSVDVNALARGLGVGAVLPLSLGVLALLIGGERVVALARRVGEGAVARLPEGRIAGWLARGVGAALGLAEGFVAGLSALRQPRRFAGVLGLTAVTWVSTGFMYVALAQALDIGQLIGWLEGMGVLVITMLGTTAPAPPGFAGVYEAACRGALALFGVTGGDLDARALAFALVMHWWVFLVQAVTAVFFFSAEGMSVAGVIRDARAASAAQA
ncbi:MAG: flippase-like domain-containing protein [Alphaproteobacteria bacterium]|nr:flippase-like domain-containing protein [Alphaproteobacteria bacterium]